MSSTSSNAYETEYAEYPATQLGTSPIKFGVWLFLASEVMFFTGLLGSYVVLRFAQPAVFHEDAAKLNWMLAALNTAILISSSFTMVLAVKHAHAQKLEDAGKFLIITFLLGCAFLGLKAIEYGMKIEHGIVPSTSLFFASYFTLTGCHALHIIGGLIPMLLLFRKARNGTLTGEGTELLGLYWHFVDLVWIFLFPLLYLL
ncbi:MAG TPA: cytochrome c oxidase subunit 3 [Planctomycetota bacterium]|nr:cytochrome c oxidase subunit 3 [Planctomycetota bacterium]